MTKYDAIQRAIQHKRAMKRAIKIINYIDRQHPEYPMPMEMWTLLEKEVGDADTFLYDNGIDEEAVE